MLDTKPYVHPPWEPDAQPKSEPDTHPISAPGAPETALAPRGKKQRGLLWGLLLLVALAAAGGGWWWLRGQPQQQAVAAPKPMIVSVITVTPRTVPIYRSFPATTAAMRVVPIQARVTGYVVERGAADGADVETGTLLYRIDPSDYRAALAQAKGQVDHSKAALSYSQANQGRNKALVRNGWVSRDTFDQTNSTLGQSVASLATDQASLLAAALNLSRTDIRAPFAGRISRSQVFEGSLISVAGTTLNTIVQLDPIYVSLNPAEANLDAINRAQARAPIETAVSIGTDQSSHAGTVTFLDNQVDQLTGTILVRATIANADHALISGQYVTARLHLGDRDGALLVPQTAVGSTQLGRTLMIVGAGDKAEQRIVKLGDSYGDMIVVTDGLKAGDRVITGNLQKLRPGILVQAQAQKVQ